MPPRKPKQPARKPPAAKQAAGKKGASKKAAPKKVSQKPDFNPDTHVLGADGKVHAKKVVSGTGAAVGVNRETKTGDHLELEAKMVQAIHKAHSDGLTDPEHIRARILAVRDEHLQGK